MKKQHADNPDVEPDNEENESSAGIDEHFANPEASSDPASDPADALQAARDERDAFEDKWLRAEAELDNFRKRTLRESRESRLYHALPLIRDLLPALDNLERAIAASESGASAEELLQGVKMVSQQLAEVLGRHAVEPISAEGEAFDPNLHEAVQQAPTAEHPPMTVLNEVERGYRLHDRVIRPSKVIVASAPPADEEGDDDAD